jgi:hypothetical protein
MKFLLMTAIFSISAFANDCKDIQGSFSIDSFTAHCTVEGVDYTPGDDSPLYTFFPKYEKEVIREEGTINGTNGYLQPNSVMNVSVQDNCKTFNIKYEMKKGIFEDESAQSFEILTFKNARVKKGITSVTTVEKTPWSCDYGICGKSKETRTLKLSADSSGDLKLYAKRKVRASIYGIPSITTTTMSCLIPRKN